MSIRHRLSVFFFSMLILVIFIALFFQITRPIIVGAFSQSLDSMNSLNSIRELRSNILTEKTSINRYLLLDDPQEYLRFNEASKMTGKMFETINSEFGKNSPDWFKSLMAAYQSADSTALRVAQDYKNGWKAKAHDEWSTSLSPSFQVLMEVVNKTEQEKKTQAELTFKRIREMSEKISHVVIVVFLLILLVGFYLFQSLYRAIINPLLALERGAHEFGKGHWDHKISLSSRNEFGSLAKAFNTMSDNVKQLQLQTMHLDRMSTVGQLAGGVAHEINNPLTAVLGQVQILLAKTPETDAQYSSLKKIENAALRCRKIVRGLLDFSRPTQSSFESIDINHVINETLDLCEADLRKSKINIEKKLALNLPKTSGSSSELQQVFLNLINNSIHAMPKGGVLTLESRVIKKAAFSSPSAGGSFIEVIVQDNGVGILSEHITKVFEPFFTTKEIGKGTGLGLAVSLGIVKKHGGEMHVESEGVNRGASFFVLFPVNNKKPVEKTS